MNKKITIPEPCHENWNDMTPEEQGRHCKVCNKTVVDFTKSSKEEIVEKVENSSENVCGRFTNRQVVSSSFPIKKVAASLIAVTSIGLQQYTAQEHHKVGMVAIHEDVQTNSKNMILKGQVKFHHFDENSANSALITVYSMGNVIGNTMSTTDGYSIQIKPNLIVNDHITIKVEHKEMGTKLIENIEVTKDKMTLDIVMEEEIMLLGEVELQHDVPQEQNCIKGKVKIE